MTTERAICFASGAMAVAAALIAVRAFAGMADIDGAVLRVEEDIRGAATVEALASRARDLRQRLGRMAATGDGRLDAGWAEVQFERGAKEARATLATGSKALATIDAIEGKMHSIVSAYRAIGDRPPKAGDGREQTQRAVDEIASLARSIDADAESLAAAARASAMDGAQRAAAARATVARQATAVGMAGTVVLVVLGGLAVTSRRRRRVPAI